MLLVEGDTFTMGCDLALIDKIAVRGLNISCEAEGEKTRKKIRLNDFFLADRETTVRQYDLYCRLTGSELPGGNQKFGLIRERPVVGVSWLDAVKYCNWLNERSGQNVLYPISEGDRVSVRYERFSGYHLPTEAEWEYAARGGNRAEEVYIFSGNDSLEVVGWYYENSLQISETTNALFPTSEVGLKLANDLDLYDMSGNVWEWRHDMYLTRFEAESAYQNPSGPLLTDGEHVLRGGSVQSSLEDCNITARMGKYFTFTGEIYGFRVAKGVLYRPDTGLLE